MSPHAGAKSREVPHLTQMHGKERACTVCFINPRISTNKGEKFRGGIRRGNAVFAEFAAPVNSGSCPIFDLLARFDKSGRKVGRALSITVGRDYLSR